MAQRRPLGFINGQAAEIPATDQILGDAGAMNVTETGTNTPKTISDAFAGKIRKTGDTMTGALIVGDTTVRYPVGLILQESADAASGSKRSGLNIGVGWQLGQDFSATGNRSAYLYNIQSGSIAFVIDSNTSSVEFKISPRVNGNEIINRSIFDPTAAIIAAPSLSTPVTSTPALHIKQGENGMGLGVRASGTSVGAAKFWAGEGFSSNRTDSDDKGAIGQGRIHATHNLIWIDRIDNGTSNGSSADPSHQPPNGLNTVSCLYLEHTCGGGTGVRETVRVNTIFDTPSKTWNVNNNIVGARYRVSVLCPDGGTTGSGFSGAKGAFFALNPECFAAPGATNLLEVALSEGNVGLRNGASARILYGHSVVKLSEKQGDVIDAAFSTGALPGSTPFKDQILFSDVHGGNPIDPNGSLIRLGQYNGTTFTVDTIFDFSALSNCNYILKAPLVDIRPSVFALTSGALTMIISGLPRTDPHIPGHWWVDTGGIVRMSLS